MNIPVARIKRNVGVLVFAAALATILDQISKQAILQSLSPFDAPQRIIGDLLRFKLTYNPHGVFGLAFGPNYLYYLLTGIGILAFTAIGLTQERRFTTIVFGMIIGGAIGNMIDRIRMDYVIDFIDMGIGVHRWFVYNLGDAFITIGAVLLIVWELFSPKVKAQTSTRA